MGRPFSANRGEIVGVQVFESSEDDVRSLVSEMAAVASFRPNDHALEIEGTCVRADIRRGQG